MRTWFVAVHGALDVSTMPWLLGLSLARILSTSPHLWTIPSSSRRALLVLSIAAWKLHGNSLELSGGSLRVRERAAGLRK